MVLIDSFIATLFNWIVILFYFIYYYAFGLFFIDLIPAIKDLQWFSKKNKIPSLVIYGIFTNIIFLQLWNILFPINKYCTIILIFIALGKLITKRPTNYQFYYDIIKNKKNILGIFFICTFWIANQSNADLGPADTGLYHLQHIKWLQSFPLTKGLANLLFHLGYNSSLFLLIANFKNSLFLNYFLWNHSGFLLCLGFLYFLVIPMNALFKHNKDVNPIEIVMKLIMNIPLVHYSFYYHPSTSTDLIPFIFGIILSVEIFKNLFYKTNNLLFIFCIIFIGISSKLSFIVFGFTSTLIILYVNRNTLLKVYSSQLIIYVFLILFSISTWLYRNTILSGYPLYPYHKLYVPVEWQVKKEVVKEYAALIKDTASGIEKAVSDEEKKKLKKAWILSRLSLQHRRVETSYPILLGIIGLVYLLLKSNRKKLLFLFLVPSISQIILWYFYTPDSRFGCFAFWWFGSLISFPIGSYYKKIPMFFPLFVLMISFSFHLIDAIGQVKPMFLQKMEKVIPQPELKKIITASGLEVWAPKEGPYCFDSPIPCSPDVDSSLQIIGNTNIFPGFKK